MRVTKACQSNRLQDHVTDGGMQPRDYVSQNVCCSSALALKNEERTLVAWYFFIIISVQQTNHPCKLRRSHQNQQKRNVITTHIHQHAGEQSLFAESSKHFNVCLFVFTLRCISETLFLQVYFGNTFSVAGCGRPNFHNKRVTKSFLIGRKGG